MGLVKKSYSLRAFDLTRTKKTNEIINEKIKNNRFIAGALEFKKNFKIENRNLELFDKTKVFFFNNKELSKPYCLNKNSF